MEDWQAFVAMRHLSNQNSALLEQQRRATRALEALGAEERKRDEEERWAQMCEERDYLLQNVPVVRTSQLNLAIRRAKECTSLEELKRRRNWFLVPIAIVLVGLMALLIRDASNREFRDVCLGILSISLLLFFLGCIVASSWLPFKDARLVSAVVLKKKVKRIERLLKKGANPNMCNEYGYPLLQFCASRGDIEVLNLLLDNGANPNCYNTDGETPLYWALANGNDEAAVILVRYGAKNLHLRKRPNRR